MARLGPSGLAQLFREIANYVSTRLSNYNTKAELDSLLDAKADDNNVIHTSGDEYINGTKLFSNTIYRYADLTTNGGEQVYRFDDTNANACGHIFNNAHWDANAVFNRHGAYNAKSGKSMEIDITSNDAGVGMIYAAGTAIKGNLETVTSATGHTGIATMGWVSNPATSTNVVHRSGDETISGVKSFNNLMYIYDNMSNKNSRMDLFTTPANTLYSHYMFVDKNDEVSAFMQYGQQNTGTDFIGLFVHDKNRALHGIRVTTNKEFIPLHNNTFGLGSATNVWNNAHIANTYTNRVTTYSIVHPTDDSYLFMSGGSEWNKGATLYLGGISATNFTPGRFSLMARGTNANFELAGSPDGTLTWGGKNVAIDENYVTLTSLAGGNRARSLSHSVGSLILAQCHYSAFYGTKSYANVAGQHLYPCRTEIHTAYSQGFTPIVVLGNDSSLGSGTWRYLGGSDGDFNDAAGRVYGMFLRVA